MSRYVDMYPHVFPSLPHTYVKTTYGHLYAYITTHQKEKRQRADKQPKLQFQHFALVWLSFRQHEQAMDDRQHLEQSQGRLFAAWSLWWSWSPLCGGNCRTEMHSSTGGCYDHCGVNGAACKWRCNPDMVRPFTHVHLHCLGQRSPEQEESDYSLGPWDWTSARWGCPCQRKRPHVEGSQARDRCQWGFERDLAFLCARRLHSWGANLPADMPWFSISFPQLKPSRKTLQFATMRPLITGIVIWPA